ncbi:glycosyltransferase [Roseomonas sp. HF4]|uniref:glycosyltransferase n=1 Tax=Roseomonas sp. HF4 TaxID=2562313 RepID=UPI0014857B5E|nr:glycosyltransferase [Roseomonas sp. HF4]
MRIAIVDHYFHQKTLSSEFFVREVLAGCAIERFWDESWAGGSTATLIQEVLEGEFDLILVWQAEETARRLGEALAARGRGNMVFVPMWDGCRTLGAQFWQALKPARILSFSRTLHERVSRFGLLSHHVQYFPDPAGVTDVSAIADAAAFLWCRVPQIGWPEMRAAFGTWRPDRVHLHLAPDPPAKPESLRLPSAADREAFHITTSEWFPDGTAFRATLHGSNIFFAPRLVEGIGMATLEAMAAGMCVVAHDAPTMNEYIVSGVNGILADMTAPTGLDFAAHRRIGARARDVVSQGHAAWRKGLADTRDFVLDPGAGATRALWTSLRLRDAGTALPERTPDLAIPRVTVATVVRDDPEGLAATIGNVARQDYGNLEYIVLDGGSQPPTVDVIRRHEHLLARWVSEPDLGPFDAMNKAAVMATGDYIIFMNAGDWFAGPDAISRALHAAPADADFVIGHHIYRKGDTEEELHRAADFDRTWAQLREGAIDGDWLQGVPGHQATFVRTALLRAHRYDCRFRICADHEFLYRMRRAGARIHHSLQTIAVYAAGGYSERNRLRLADEWSELASRYGNDQAVMYFHDLRSHVLRDPDRNRPDLPGPTTMTAAALAAECMTLREETAALRAEITRMRRSASWIVTYPLRWIMRRAGPARALWVRLPLPGRHRPPHS